MFCLLFVPTLFFVFVFPFLSEKPEADTMKRPPRKIEDHLVDWRLLLHAFGFLGIIESFTAFFLFFAYFNSQGISPCQLVFAFEAFQGQDANGDHCFVSSFSCFDSGLVVILSAFLFEMFSLAPSLLAQVMVVFLHSQIISLCNFSTRAKLFSLSVLSLFIFSFFSLFAFLS